jgi:hypothetical protein
MRSGSDIVFKLGQKVRTAPGSPERVLLTNMYLTKDEFDLLDQLEGASLHKTRWKWSSGDDVLSVDEFAGHLRGLVLAEIELTDDESRHAAPPLALADVTGEDRFSGGRLAHLSVGEAGKLQESISEIAREGGKSSRARRPHRPAPHRPPDYR